MDGPQDFIPDSQFTPDQQSAQPAAVSANADFIPDSQFKPDAATPTADDKYGTTGQQIGAGLEGVAQGVAGPLATAAETGLSKLGVPGLSGEDQRGRAEANPWTHGIGETLGFAGSVASGVGLGSAVAKAGSAVTGLVGLGKAVNVGAKLAAGATAAATEMGILGASNEVSKLIQGDPNQTIGSAVTNTGLSSVLGGLTGGAFTGVGLGAGKILDSTILKEFSDRLASPFSGSGSRELVHHEAENVVSQYNAMNSEVSGASGLKAQAIEKLLPEMPTPKMASTVEDINNKALDTITKMRQDGVPDRYIQKFQNDLDNLKSATWPTQSPTSSQYFDALNTFKQDMQDYSKGNYGPFAVPRYHEAYDFINATKNIARDTRLALEDSGAWGKAADIQKQLNASWSNVLPAMKEFSKKFMVEGGAGEKIISQDKLNTYLNQVGKATATTDKQQVLKQFVEGMSNHFEQVDKIYQAAGVENPFGPVGMSALKESLNVPSTGAKLADMLKSKLEAHTIGHGLAAAAGGGAGGYLGALVSEKALGPVFTAMVKPVLERYPNVDVKALDGAMRFLSAAQKGNQLLSASAKAAITGAVSVIPKNLIPTSDDIKSLNDQTKEYKPKAPPNGGVGFYLPSHGTAMAQQSVAAINFINSQRPNLTRANPLDAMPKETAAQKYKFNRTLEIAQQPLMAMHHISNGTLTSQDVATLRTVHPALYDKMSTELMSAAANQLHEGKIVPYKVQQSMSLFLGHPLASIFTPAAMQAAQGVFAAKQAQQAQMQAEASKGPAKLQGRAKASQTDLQSRDARKDA